MTTQEFREQLSALLKQKMEEQDFTVEHLSSLTRVPRHVIDSLFDCNFNSLPGYVFGRGFIKNICRVMNIENDEVLELYDKCWSPDEKKTSFRQVGNPKCKGWTPPPEPNFGTKKRMTKEKAMWLSGGLLSVILAAAGILLWQAPELSTNIVEVFSYSKEKIEQTKSIATQKALQTSKKAVAENKDKKTGELEKNLPKSTKLKQISFKSDPTPPVTDGKQWLEVVVLKPTQIKLSLDEGRRITMNLEKSTHNFKFISSAEILVYDASAVDLKFNGKPLGDLGGENRFRKLSFGKKVQTPSHLF